MEYSIFVFIHIIAASVWIGGHLVLMLRILPKAVKLKKFSIVRAYESAFEPIGLPSLLILILTGLRLAYLRESDITNWFNFDSHFPKHITLKLILVLITLGLAIHARFFLIPKEKLKPLSYHIILVTLVAILFALVGVSARTGTIF